MDDPQIGRFWQVDPLADKYPHNSTYAFSENKVINGVELEGLERAPAPYKASDIIKSVKGIQFTPESQATGRKVVGTGGKYVLIGVSILTLEPAPVILGIPALGLTASQDIVLAKNPNNKTAQQMPTSGGGALGMVVDKSVEAATGKKNNGTFQAIGEFAESAYNISQLKKPVISKNVVENVDKGNTVVEFVDKTMKLLNNLLVKPPPPTPSPPSKVKKHET